jgi:hypothetical protein
MTHRRTWQKAEGRAAALFNTHRQPGSGSGGRPDQTRSDSVHPRLFLEVKLRVSHAARSLHDETRILAKREHKTPVVLLADKSRAGFLVCVHSDDMEAVFVEWAAANASDELEGAIRRAVVRNRGLDPDDPC